MPENRFQAMAIKVTKYALYSLTLILAFFFTEQMVCQYWEGSTYFSTSQKAVTKEDLPTVTFCIFTEREIIYGRNFLIQTLTNYTNCRITNCENVTLMTLAPGKNEYAFQPGRKDVTFLRQLNGLNTHEAYKFKKCIALDLNLEDPEANDVSAGYYGAVGGYKVSFHLNNKNLEYYNLAFFIIKFYNDIRPQDINDATAHLTTKANSYGAAYFKWYDGTARPFHLKKGVYQTVNIIQINRYEYLEGTCEHISFYECLGSKISQSKECQENGRQCSTYSLPTKRFGPDYPPCQTKAKQIECNKYRMAAMDMCMGQKPCIVQDYLEEVDPLWSVKDDNVNSSNLLLRKFLKDDIVDVLLENQNSKFMFWPSFCALRSGRGIYGQSLRVDVHKEHWALTDISLVGNIGGQLGLCIGFSLTGFIAWLLDIFPKGKFVLEEFLKRCQGHY